MERNPGASQAVAWVQNTITRLEGLSASQMELVDSLTRYRPEAVQGVAWRPPDADWAPVWDGWRHLSRFPAPGQAEVPTGLVDRVLAGLGPACRAWDCRTRPPEGVPERHALPLRLYQQRAAEAAWREGYGILDMCPRAGKTLTMMEIQRGLSQPACWICPTTNIVTQTVRAAERWFGRHYAEAVRGPQQAAQHQHAAIVCCTSATARSLPAEFWAGRRMLVVDEIHHAMAGGSLGRHLMRHTGHIFHRFGMSGTWFRSQSVEDLELHAFLSRVICRVEAQDLVQQGYLVPADVLLMPVDGPRVTGQPSTTWHEGLGLAGIYGHEHRNRLAAWAACRLALAGRQPLVLVGTRAQGQWIAQEVRRSLPRLPGSGWEACEFVSTDRPPKVCQEVIDGFVSGQAGIRVLVGTSMVGEGTDLPSADALVYAPGGKAEVQHQQATYRVCTAQAGKRRALIVDFADRHHPTLTRHSLERLQTYCGQAIFRVAVLAGPEGLEGWLDRPAERGVEGEVAPDSAARPARLA